ncbi:ATP-binding protein [Lachnobacterium bovis]|uniref:ATP-binding protein n=1 Tax=Lachnobacterium bovis TaxID=140626 RepID=UPI000483DA5B|nr:AAA family ATPase [Lachnobacterium bovis]
MRLIKCHIDNFGKLQDKDYSFNKSLNVFNGENGSGKSTFAAFLKAMLYGFDNKKEKGAFEKERNIYKPWQGGTYGGELEFEHQDKIYKVVRKFGNTEKTDEFHIYDMNTNMEVDCFTKHLGDELFDLDRNSFAKSIFIGQNDCNFSTSDQINAKLGNVVESTNDINNYENAQKKLKDVVNKLSPTRKTGSIRKRKDQIDTLRIELRELESREAEYKKVATLMEDQQNKRILLEKERAKLTEEQKYVSEAGTKIAEQNNYKQLCDIEDEKTKAFEEVDNFFEHECLTDEEIAKLTSDVHDLVKQGQSADVYKLSNEEQKTYDELGERLNNGAADEAMLFEAIAGNIESIEETRKLKAQLSDSRVELTNLENLFQTNEAKRNQNIPKVESAGKNVFFAAVVSAVIAVVFLIFAVVNVSKKSVFTPFIAVAIIAMIFAVVFMLTTKKQKRSAEIDLARYMQNKRDEDDREMRSLSALRIKIEEMENKIASINKEISAFLFSYELGVESEEKYQTMLYELRGLKETYDDLHQKDVTYHNARRDYEILNRRIYDYLRQYFEELDNTPEDYTEKISSLTNKVTEYKLAKDAMENAKKARKVFKEAHDDEDLVAEFKINHSLEELNRRIDEIDANLNEIRDDIEKYNRHMNDLSDQLDERDEKLELLDTLEKEQEKEQEYYNVVEKTIEFLTQAKEQFTSRYKTPVDNAFKKYYQHITGEDKENWQLDANISIKMKQEGVYREVDWLSAGYKDLVGVCMRLALVEAMFPLDKSFLILDDPFVNLDEDKLEKANDLLNMISQEYQVIYFTCHSCRMPR